MPVFDIPSWNTTPKARHNYLCDNCKGIIPKHSTYLRVHIRNGPRKGKDPLAIEHHHLDCHAPWYQPENAPLTWCMERLPGKAPPKELRTNSVAELFSAIVIKSPEIGRITWEVPEALKLKLLYAPNQEIAAGAMAEIMRAFEIFALALLAGSGHRKHGTQFNHILHELQTLFPYTPPTPEGVEK